MKIDGLSVNHMSTSNFKATASISNLSANGAEQLEPTEQQDQQEKANQLLEGEKKKEITKDEAEHFVNGLNEFLKPRFTSLNFELHEELERYYVQVIDRDTKEVIREIPPKQLLDMYAKMTEYLGLFIDEKL